MKVYTYLLIFGLGFFTQISLSQIVNNPLEVELHSDSTDSFLNTVSSIETITKALPSDIGYTNIVNDKKIDHAIVILEPYRKGWLRKQYIKAERVAIEAFVAENFPQHQLLSFKKGKGKRKKWCNGITLLDKHHVFDFSALPTDNPSKTAQFLEKYLPAKDFPRSVEVFDELLDYVTNPHEE